MPPALVPRPWMASLGTKVAYLVWAGHPGPGRPNLTGVHTPSAGAYLVLFTCPCSPHLWWHCGFLAHRLDTLPALEEGELSKSVFIYFGACPCRGGHESISLLTFSRKPLILKTRYWLTKHQASYIHARNIQTVENFCKSLFDNICQGTRS